MQVLIEEVALEDADDLRDPFLTVGVYGEASSTVRCFSTGTLNRLMPSYLRRRPVQLPLTAFRRTSLCASNVHSVPGPDPIFCESDIEEKPVRSFGRAA